MRRVLALLSLLGLLLAVTPADAIQRSDIVQRFTGATVCIQRDLHLYNPCTGAGYLLASNPPGEMDPYLCRHVGLDGPDVGVECPGIVDPVMIVETPTGLLPRRARRDGDRRCGCGSLLGAFRVRQKLRLHPRRDLPPAGGTIGSVTCLGNHVPQNTNFYPVIFGPHDTEIPPKGHAFFYLVRAYGAPYGGDDDGQGSDGTPRIPSDGDCALSGLAPWWVTSLVPYHPQVAARARRPSADGENSGRSGRERVQGVAAPGVSPPSSSGRGSCLVGGHGRRRLPRGGRVPLAPRARVAPVPAGRDAPRDLQARLRRALRRALRCLAGRHRAHAVRVSGLRHRGARLRAGARRRLPAGVPGGPVVQEARLLPLVPCPARRAVGRVAGRRGVGAGGAPPVGLHRPEAVAAVLSPRPASPGGAVALHPKMPATYYNYGNDQLLPGEHQRAVGMFSKSLRLYSIDIWAFNNRGLAYLKLGRRERARRDFEEAIRIDPGFERAQRNLEQISPTR